GLQGMSSAEKDAMRALAERGGPFTSTEATALLTYCETDVDCLVALFLRMAPGVDLGRALLRGRYMRAAARIEATGVPVDVPALTTALRHWPDVQRALIREVDKDYGVYDEQRFCSARWASWLTRNGIAWPRTTAGHLALDNDTFKE